MNLNDTFLKFNSGLFFLLLLSSNFSYPNQSPENQPTFWDKIFSRADRVLDMAHENEAYVRSLGKEQFELLKNDDKRKSEIHTLHCQKIVSDIKLDKAIRLFLYTSTAFVGVMAFGILVCTVAIAQGK